MKLYHAVLGVGVALFLLPIGGEHAFGMNAQAIVNNMFKELDTNRDGYIEEDEANDELLRDFDSYDQNGDGMIERDEAYDHFKGMIQDINDRLPDLKPPSNPNLP